MDDDLKHNFAPRRNKKYQHLASFNDLCAWAETLDWKNNDWHFLVLAKAVIESVDDELREHAGKRVDQIAGWGELIAVVRHEASLYEAKHQVIGIFIHLTFWTRWYLAEKAADRGSARKAPDSERGTSQAVQPPPRAPSC